MHSKLNNSFRWSIMATILFILSGTISAEPPTNGNPFGSGTQAPPPDFKEEDDFLDPGNSFGFQPPTAESPTTPPPVEPPAENIVPPTVPPPPSNPSAGRPSFSRPSTPNSFAGGQKTADVKPKGPSVPKLSEYLELDSSVKSLEVKNFDLPDKEIKDVVTLISKWTGKNFILDNKVRGKITIMGPSQVTLQEAYQAFLSALEANGLTTVQAGKFIRIIESAEARRAPVKTYTGEYAPKDDQFITRIIQLKYINADEVQREFRDLTTRQGKLFAYEPTNSIIITDTGSNIQRMKELLETLDVKNFETTLHVLRIRNTSAKTISDMLGEIYGDGKGGGTGQPRSFRKSALERTRGGGIITKIIPDESTNSLIVLANVLGFESLKKLVERLDVKVTDTGRIHVYYCEYAKAEDLAQTLASLASGSSGKTSRRNTSVSTAPGTAPAPSGSGGPVSAELEGGIKVTSDAATNSLVVTANSADYQTLKKVIKKLDIPRLQVFIETAILEVAVGSNTAVGVNLALGAPGRGFAGGFIGDTEAIKSAVTGGLPGEGATIPIFGGSDFQIPASGTTPAYTVSTLMGLVTLLTKTTNTSVLQTPQIIALDNEKAEFQVLDEIPVVGSTTGGTANSGPITSIEKLKTGVVVKLTPHVNAASRTIRLEIEQKVDSEKDATSVPKELRDKTKAITTRITNTSVIIKDKDYLMMGGLMSDKVDESETKVPLLGDIPILGWLFKSKGWRVSKTNLIILLRPKIIGTSLESAALLKENIKNREEFIERNFGGDDVHEEGVSKVKGALEEQVERSQTEPQFDYRNNQEEESEAQKPQDQTQLQIKPTEPAPNSSAPVDGTNQIGGNE